MGGARAAAVAALGLRAGLAGPHIEVWDLFTRACASEYPCSHRCLSCLTPAALVVLVPLVCGPDALCGVLPFGGKNYVTLRVIEHAVVQVGTGLA